MRAFASLSLADRMPSQNIALGHDHLSGVGRWVNSGGDGLDLCAQLLLDAVQVVPVLVGHKIDAQTKVAKTARSPDSVEVGFGVLGEVKVDHDIHQTGCRCHV